MSRDRWLNLNGQWEYMGGAALPDPSSDPVQAPAFPARPDHIRVPFPPESFLSGIERRQEINLWYRRQFTVPDTWKGSRVLLHFGAVSNRSAVYINGHSAGGHTGRWESFDLDVTTLLRPGSNVLVVGANDTHDGRSSTGKGSVAHGDYTFTSGIWQTVWLEPVPDSYISDLVLTPDLKTSKLHLKANITGDANQIHVSVSAGGKILSRLSGPAATELEISVPQAHLWSPADPFLYDVQVSLTNASGRTLDEVKSYFGMRSIALGLVGSTLRPLLNGRFVFQMGPLDQGYWPDGVHTAPTDAALRSDLETIKALGFNTVRKHAKVEPQRWYYWADKLGLLVWQDMPSMWFPDDDAVPVRKQFEHEWQTIIQQHFNSPAIVTWVPFNENWGAYDVGRIAAWTKAIDPTRLVNANTGYNNAPDYRKAPGDSGNGDFDDLHIYVGPGKPPQPSTTRAAALGEYGGVGLLVPGHMWPGKHHAYEMQPTRKALTDRFQQIQSELLPLIENKGLSAAIYTQTTDVEAEVNGFLTYDRKFHKMDFQRVILANKAVFAGADRSAVPQ